MGSFRAFGSSVSAMIRTSADITSSHVAPSTDRIERFPDAVRIQSVPINASACRSNRTLNWKAPPESRYAAVAARADTAATRLFSLEQLGEPSTLNEKVSAGAACAHSNALANNAPVAPRYR